MRNSFEVGFPVPREEPHPIWDVPAGHVISTAEDLAHYLIAQNNDGRYGGLQILSSAGVETMHRPQTEIGRDYAMGWHAYERDTLPIVGHGGSLETFHADALMLPEQGYGIVLLINQGGLLPNMIAYPQITSGIIDYLTGNEPTTGMAIRTIYWIIIAVILIAIALEIRWWRLKFPAWRAAAVGKPGSKLAPDIAK